MLDLADKLRADYEEKFIGKKLSFVPDEKIDGVWQVYSENYIRVYIDDKNFDVNTFVNVKPITKFKDGLLCKPL